MFFSPIATSANWPLGGLVVLPTEKLLAPNREETIFHGVFPRNILNEYLIVNVSKCLVFGKKNLQVINVFVHVSVLYL